MRDYLARIKYVTRAPQIHPIELPNCWWRLDYRNDDGSELERVDGLVRARFGQNFSYTLIACHPELWANLNSLPANFEPPAWHTFLIDAKGAMPDVGMAMVLLATSHEVLIADVLNRLAKESSLPIELWEWINGGGDWRKAPAVEEQFDVLLKVLCGHSLKEDSVLWEAFKNIRDIRNQFVHAGRPTLRKSTTPLTSQQVAALLQKGEAIVDLVRSWLPSALQWPQFQHVTTLEVQHRIGGLTETWPKAN